ncbi:surface antigen-domain-containing protein [Fomitopsis serialis]|uniref:surface antigen-domain-containing protein n=1 Tax=Fomitopsis serialis TaxID=139415 RepID=UPI0020079CD4|nr:surface antigen-domain-containing protein [Neoantrodia serialis]KAH9924208.1 surface antigen-domain-containing protein [Neoantrodia serialis]
MADADSHLDAPSLRPPLANTSAPRDREPPHADLDKLRKWQEERIARKLRGEYESAVLHLAEVVNDNMSTPLRLASIRVEGAARTRQSFLSALVTPFLPPPVTPSFSASSDHSSSLGDVLHKARHIGSLLQETDIFQSVEARLEGSRDFLARPGDVDLVLRTRERGRFYLNTSTQVGNNEGGASATCRVRNAFGGAELLQANLAFATTTRVAFSASLSAPLLPYLPYATSASSNPNLNTRGEISIFGHERDNTTFASSFEGVRGLRAAVRTGTLRKGTHELAYEGVLRHIGNLAPTASISIREAGPSIKSAVSHTYMRDTRDDALLGTQGSYVKLSHELAGLGGDTSFFKTEGATQLARKLLPGVTVSVAGRSGLLWGLDGRPVPFSDRFQLGGPMSVRMFRANGLGPQDGPDSLGGDMYWAAGLSVIGDIPRRPHWPVKLQGFVNLGRLDSMDKSRSLIDNVRESISKPSVGAGVGLVYKLDAVRVEVNFGVPLVASKSDGVRKGIQVGIGLDFL